MMNDVATILQKLPETCFAKLPSTGEVIGLRRGMSGYVPLSKPPAGWSLEQLNQGIATKAQVEAMLAGSLFGWHVPAADPDNYDAEGRFKNERINQ
jgi:hypothetical protein